MPRRTLNAPERAHDRVEQERDQRRDEEEEDHVSRRLREQPREATRSSGSPTSWIQRGIWIRGGGPAGVIIAPIVQRARPATAASAGLRSAAMTAPGARPSPALVRRRGSALPGRRSATVPMSPPSAPGRCGALPASHDARQAPARRRRSRSSRRRARHAARHRLRWRRPSGRRVTAPASAARLLPAGPPMLPGRWRELGALTLQLPVNQSRITAIGYYAASDGAARRSRRRHAGEPGPPEAASHMRSSAAARDRRAGTSSPAGTGRRPRRSTSAPPPAPTSTRP